MNEKPLQGQKTIKTRSDTAVQGTNDNSIVSKCSSAERGFFSDDYLQFFVGKKARRCPLINWGYYIRAKAIDSSVSQFLDLFDGLKQIINVGAGFDSTYFRLHALGKLKDVQYYEVDFRDLLMRKLALIKQSDVLLSMVDPDVESFESSIVHLSSNYAMIGADLTHYDQLSSLFHSAGIDAQVPTLLLSEVVLAYIQPKEASGVVRWAAELFKNAIFITYEQIHPEDNFGRFMCQHFKNLGSPLKSIDTFPTLTSQADRYKSMGWNNVDVIDMNTFFNSLMSEEKQRVISLEPFDEYEEWQLKCAHYVCIRAAKGLCSQLIHNTSSVSVLEDDLQLIKIKDLHISDLKCFGHQSCMLSINKCDHVVTVGGFGDRDLKAASHGRLCAIHLTNMDTKSTVVINSECNLTERLYHTATRMLDNSILLLWGRRSPVKAIPSAAKITFTSQTKSISAECEEISINSSVAPRWRHSAVCVPYEGSQHLMVFGGKDNERVFNDCHLLNLQTFQWTSVPTDLAPRHSHSADLWKNEVIMAGGLDLNLKPIGRIHSLNLKDLKWRLIDTQYFCPRYSHCSAIVNNTLYMVGGISLLPSSPVMSAVNLESGVVISYKYELPKGIWMLHGQSSVVKDGEMILTGGGGNCFSFGTHLNSSFCSLKLPLV